LSYGFGKFANINWPKPLNKALINWFVNTYKINLDEIGGDVGSYNSLGDFFVRTLKAGARPIGEGLVHPCDAVISEFGKIENQTLIQAKGINYQLIDLLRSQDLAAELSGGTYITYYLCPADYHRVHAPADMLVHSCTHIPGQLWPVNAWSVNNIKNLFPRNERLVARLEIDKKPAALVMVGATNVGKMTLDFDTRLVTNNLSSKLKTQEYRPPVLMKAGDPFGAFHMGSTVVMIYSAAANLDLTKIKRQHVLMGSVL
jgi:phosphatidylserine decarboxylase